MPSIRKQVVEFVSASMSHGTPFATAVALAESVNSEWRAWIDSADEKGGRTWARFRGDCSRGAGAAQ